MTKISYFSHALSRKKIKIEPGQRPKLVNLTMERAWKSLFHSSCFVQLLQYAHASKKCSLSLLFQNPTESERREVAHISIAIMQQDLEETIQSKKCKTVTTFTSENPGREFFQQSY
jgi:hypothetical protein